MRFLKRLTSLVLAAALAFAPLPALAQGPSFTQPIANYATYSAAAAFAPATTATSDFFTLTGAAGKLIRVTRAECWGTATAATVVPISAIVRSAVPTVAGTSTTPTVVAHDQTDGTGSGVVRAYTVAPTAGAAIGTVRITPMFTTPTGTAAQTNPMVLDFTTRPAERQGIALRSATQVFALNTTAPAGAAFNCSVTWTVQ